MYNGNIQILDKKNKKISEISFETYDLNLAPYVKQESGHIYPDEQSTNEIIRKIKKRSYDNQEFAELNNRFISPLYAYCLALLPLLIFKLSRKPDESWFLPILLVSITGLIIKFLEVTLANIMIDNNSYYIINYLVPFGIIVIILFLLYRENYKFIRIRNVL